MDSHLKELIHQRRRVALAYRRSPSAGNHRRLEEIDQELARYNIDLPGIQHWFLQDGSRNRRPSHLAPHSPEPTR